MATASCSASHFDKCYFPWVVFSQRLFLKATFIIITAHLWWGQTCYWCCRCKERGRNTQADINVSLSIVATHKDIQERCRFLHLYYYDLYELPEPKMLHTICCFFFRCQSLPIKIGKFTFWMQRKKNHFSCWHTQTEENNLYNICIYYHHPTVSNLQNVKTESRKVLEESVKNYY